MEHLLLIIAFISGALFMLIGFTVANTEMPEKTGNILSVAGAACGVVFIVSFVLMFFALG